MENFTLNAGTIVKVNGIPFGLESNVLVSGTESNFKMLEEYELEERQKKYNPDYNYNKLYSNIYNTIKTTDVTVGDAVRVLKDMIDCLPHYVKTGEMSDK